MFSLQDLLPKGKPDHNTESKIALDSLNPNQQTSQNRNSGDGAATSHDDLPPGVADFLSDQPEAAEELEEVGNTKLTKEQFATLFNGGFAMGNSALGFVVPGGPLHSLDLSQKPKEARTASDALYELAEDIPSLNWMIDPHSRVIGNCMVLGAFGFGLASGLRKEIGYRKAAMDAQKRAKAGQGDTMPESPIAEAFTAPVTEEPETDA